ncbi:MAG TPA: Na+:solute symporter [Candidatus Omnitrophota bacterium]|nr:Na+:solute symporter [Candidatus Omnitrophota bacterium]
MLIDLFIVLAFVIYSVSAGLAARKKASENLEQYFLAGRSLKGWQAGISMSATQFAADTPLLVTGLIATAGIFSLWRLWVYAIAFLMLGFIFSSSWRRAKVLTDAEFTELRYAGKGAAVLRAIKAVHLGTLVNCSVLAMVLIAAVRISEPFLLWHEWLPAPFLSMLASLLETANLNFSSLPNSEPFAWTLSASNLISILLIVFFTTLYSATGGLRGVVMTDIVQFAIMMIATGVYAVFIVGEIGGLDVLIQRLTELYGTAAVNERLAFSPLRWDSVAALGVAVLAVQWFAQSSSDGTGYLAQRSMACHSDREAKIASLIFTYMQIFIRSLFWIVIALGLLVLYPANSLPELGMASESFRVAREATFASGIHDFLPPFARGLMLTGMLAALASTLDTHLNWGASYWTNDLYKRFIAPQFLRREPRPRELVWVARLSNLGILCIALVIMANLSSIQNAWHMSLLFGSGLGVVLILRWLWYRINIGSEYAAVISSLIGAPILLIGFPEMREETRLLTMLAISTAAVLSVTLLTAPESEQTLGAFYKKTQPPGFWGPVAVKAGEASGAPGAKFFRLLLAVFCFVGSVFGLLISAGMFMTQRGGWHSVVLAIAGAILMGFGWRFGFNEDYSAKSPVYRKER